VVARIRDSVNPDSNLMPIWRECERIRIPNWWFESSEGFFNSFADDHFCLIVPLLCHFIAPKKKKVPIWVLFYSLWSWKAKIRSSNTLFVQPLNLCQYKNLYYGYIMQDRRKFFANPFQNCHESCFTNLGFVRISSKIAKDSDSSKPWFPGFVPPLLLSSDPIG
jgi:hypothetical protein